MNANPPKRAILLIEDSEDDVFFLRRALSKSALPWNLHVVMDGQEALDFLAGTGKFSDRTNFPLPALVLLDLKLPYVGGFEVLGWMRTQPDLKDIPVFILTSSPEERDQRKAAELGASAYLVKPPTVEMLRNIASQAWPSCAASV